METKWAAVLAEVGSGELTVTAACARLGISRQSYYKYRSRFDADGAVGLLARSRRPRSSPRLTPAGVVAEIVRARAELAKDGWDNGATSIWAKLALSIAAGESGLGPAQLPTRRTIHRVLVREGLVVSQPDKRLRSSYRRFEFPATDDCWQLDAWEYRLLNGTPVVVFELLDDRSRFLVDALAWPAETAEGAWECFTRAARRYGLPVQVLSDNSLAFTGRLVDRVVSFEHNLDQLGVGTIHSSPRHPQTCGKNERHHQTSQRWLARHTRGPGRCRPGSLDQLQALLDRYRDAYNHRPHQALSQSGQPPVTPAEQRAASLRLEPVERAPAARRTTADTRRANSRGALKVTTKIIGLGIEHAGREVTVFRTGDRVQIFAGHHPIADITLRPDCNYYSIRPRTRMRKSSQATPPELSAMSCPEVSAMS